MTRVIVSGLAQRLRQLRESRGWSLDELAKKVERSKAGLWQVEQERSEPSASTLAALAKAFGVSADFLLFGAVQSNRAKEELLEIAARLAAIAKGEPAS